MSELVDLSWEVTMLKPSPEVMKAPNLTTFRTTFRAQTCEEQNGALVFRGGDHLSIKVILAAGQWVMVEKEGGDIK